MQCPFSRGPVSDASGNGRHATAFDGIAPPSSVSGAFPDGSNAALSFDGSNDYVGLPSGFADFTGGLTLEAWLYPTAVQNYSRIIDLGNGNDNDTIRLGRRANSNDLYFRVFRGTSGGAELVAPNVLQLNTWQYIAVTLDTTGKVTFYRDGLRVAASTTWLPNNITRTSNYIARSNWFGDAYYKGRLDEVAVYPGALPESRIQAHYLAAGYQLPQAQAPAPPYQAAVVADAPSAYWRLDEQVGKATAWDLTNHGNNAPIQVGVTQAATGALADDANPAVTFDGTVGYLPVPPGFDFQVSPSDPAFTGLTIEAWIQPTVVRSYARIVDFGNGQA